MTQSVIMSYCYLLLYDSPTKGTTHPIPKTFLAIIVRIFSSNKHFSRRKGNLLRLYLYNIIWSITEYVVFSCLLTTFLSTFCALTTATNNPVCGYLNNVIKWKHRQSIDLVDHFIMPNQEEKKKNQSRPIIVIYFIRPVLLYVSGNKEDWLAAVIKEW